MKKKTKLTYSKLALGNLKHRKKQYTFLIIGIILSMVFSSSALFLLVGSISSAEETKNYRYGKQDGMFFNMQDYPKTENSFYEFFPDGGKMHILGYAYNSESGTKTGTSVAYLDDNAKILYEPIVLEGNFPQNEGEIAIEKSALSYLNTDAEIGDKLTVSFLVQNGNDYLEKEVEKTYTLTAVLSDKRSNLEPYIYSNPIKDTTKKAVGIPSAFVCEKERIEIGGREAVTGVFKSTQKSSLGTSEVTDTKFRFYEYANIEDFDFLDPAMAYEDNVLLYFYQPGEPFLVTLILCVVLLLVSNLGIINSFSTNLKERKKQIGLLRCVGATKPQIRKIYIREAAVLSLICAPVSILISALSVSVVVKAFNELYVFKPTWWTFPVGIVTGILCVFFAAIIPLVSISRVSPMQAIRNVSFTHKIRKKKIKTKRNFNVSKLVAKRNFLFFKQANIVTSVILAIAIGVSVFGFTFINVIFNSLWAHQYRFPDYYIECGTTPSGGSDLCNYPTGTGLTENNKQDIMVNPYVEAVYGTKFTKGFIFAEEFTDFMRLNMYESSYFHFDKLFDLNNAGEDFYTKENYKKTVEVIDSENFEETFIVKEDLKLDGNLCPVHIIGVDDEYMEILKSNVSSGSIDTDKLDSGEEVIIAVDKEIALIDETSSYYDDVKDVSFKRLRAYNTASIDYENALKTGGELYETAKNDFKVGDTLDIGWAQTTYNRYTQANYVTDEGVYSVEGQEILKDYNPSLVKYDYLRNTTKIGAIIHELPEYYQDYVNDARGIKIITTVEGLENFASNIKYDEFMIHLNTDATEEINTDVMTMLNSYTDGGNYFLRSDYERRNEENREWVSSYILILSVVILFFAMCGSMVNNSITARIREGKKKIGTLRAVGSSSKELVSSYIYQLTLVLGMGTIGGIALTLIGYMVYELILYSVNPLHFEFISLNLVETTAAVLLLFTFCALNMYFKIKKEMKNSIVDNIREL